MKSISMDNPFGPEVLAKAVNETLPELAKEEAHIGVAAQNNEVGVEGSISKTLGSKGVFVEGQGSFFMRSGYRVAAMLGWRKKQ